MYPYIKFLVTFKIILKSVKSVLISGTFLKTLQRTKENEVPIITLMKKDKERNGSDIK